MLQGHTMAIVPCGNPTPKKLPTGGGEWPTFRTARAQRTVRPHVGGGGVPERLCMGRAWVIHGAYPEPRRQDSGQYDHVVEGHQELHLLPRDLVLHIPSAQDHTHKSLACGGSEARTPTRTICVPHQPPPNVVLRRAGGGRQACRRIRCIRPRGYVCPVRTRRARHPNPWSGHPSQCLTPKHHSLLQPRLPDPCRLGGPRVGGMATSPLPSRGSPDMGTKNGKKWGQLENRGKFCRARLGTLRAVPSCQQHVMHMHVDGAVRRVKSVPSAPCS